METLFDLPTHPLMVHFPAVAIPVLAIAAVALAFVPKLRRQYGLLVAVLAVVTVISTFLAVNSGQALADGLNYPDSQIGTHRDLGETLRWFVLGLGVTIVALIAYIGTPRGANLPAQAANVLKGLVVVFAVLSLVWAIRTGHEGSKSVWEEQGALLSASDDEQIDATASETSEATTTVAPTTAAPTTAAPTTAAPTTSAAPTTAAPTSAAPTTSAATTTSPATSAPGTATTTSGAIGVGDDDGEEVYLATCARCHADDGTGVAPRPALTGIGEKVDDVDLIIERVTNGGRFMPDFGDDLTPEEIAAVSEYVLATF